ncbi:ATPase/histidine kinase/DNA gyrase B/HSP90 domain protein [Opisthorchis viverrini]|uniref:Protein-serine/threonine kinase n=1 Tax=Opisthorchis viverrini TaxID=6198 RepID=A0A1S8X6B9_OPIVI|nr:ATPase/histidine kinase/DNA gyrase B/HSP90 domain protein [Opisthorchis viverrini]
MNPTKTTRFNRLILYFIYKISDIPPHVQTIHGRFTHWESRSYQLTPDIMSDKERLDSVSAYYSQSAVDVAAAKHNMYLKSFRRLTEEPPVETFEDETRFSKLLRTILNEHSSVISMLATGFKECRSRITVTLFLQDTNLITDFLNRTLTSRMATRLLAEHHLALRENRPHHVGIIDQRMALTDVVKKQIELVSGMFQLEYGMAPEVILAGQTDLVFPYIRIPLDYILTELFKNAFRATIESRCRTAGKLPPIYVTLASDEVDFWIRITDHAGGIPSDLEHAIWEYHVSTPAAAKVEAGWEQASTKHGSHSVVKEPNVLPPPTATGGALGPHARLSQTDDIDLPLNAGASSQILPSNKIFCSITQHQVTKSIHGFGFGLPLSRAYARQLGGDLQMYAIRSIGTDCYLRLRHIDGKTPSFRI